MNFNEALDAMKAGKVCKRKGWKQVKGLFILEHENKKKKNQSCKSFTFYENPDYCLIGYMFNSTDILSEDWEIVDASIDEKSDRVYIDLRRNDELD